MPNHKSTVKDDADIATWADAIRDIEAEIERAKERIGRLEGIKRVCQRFYASKEPFDTGVIEAP